MSWKAAVQRRQGLSLEIAGQKSRGAGSTKRKRAFRAGADSKDGTKKGKLVG